MKKYKYIFIVIFIISGDCYGQIQKSYITPLTFLKRINAEFFQFKTDSITIDGVFIGNNTKQKPLILFIQGSEPIPLFCFSNDTTFYPLFPHQLIDENRNRFNFIFLSRNGIPALANIKELDNRYCFVDKNTHDIPRLYIKSHTLDFYNLVYLDFIEILKKNYTYSQLIVIGHSEGARIAAEISVCPLIDKLVYMCADPLGRIATQYDKEYEKFHERDEGKIQFYNSVFDTTKQGSLYMRDTYKSWVSFSRPSIISLTKGKIPKLIVYGEMDKNCPNCYVFSFLPSYYKNISVISYKEYDHNFFDTKRKNNWNLVVDDIYNWIEKP